MEIKKEDFVRFHIVDTQFYALPMSFFKEEEKIIEEIVDEIIEEVVIEPTKEELAAIAKAEKVAKLKEELEALEA